jgi:hypothetical protein
MGENIVDVGVFLATAPENLMGPSRWCMKLNDRPVGKPQEKVLMNIATSFPSVKIPRYVDQEKSRQYD